MLHHEESTGDHFNGEDPLRQLVPIIVILVICHHPEALVGEEERLAKHEHKLQDDADCVYVFHQRCPLTALALPLVEAVHVETGAADAEEFDKVCDGTKIGVHPA